jgi:heme/copper-type cytochrome/quinol oxidase subunit 2
LAVLISVIAWLVISYLPTGLVPLPSLSLTVFGPQMRLLGVGALLAFLVIQFVVLFATTGAVRAYLRRFPAGPPLELRLGKEVFWTAVPIAMTVALVWASLAQWSVFAAH